MEQLPCGGRSDVPQRPAGLRRAVEDHDIVPTEGGELRRLQAAWPGAGDEHPPRLFGLRDGATGLAAHVGVVEAGDVEAGKLAVVALIGADAPPDAVGVTSAHLDRDVGIGDVPPGHGDEVAIAVGEGLLALLGRQDAPDPDDRHGCADRRSHGVGELQLVSGSRSVRGDGDRRVVGRLAADARVEVVDHPGLDDSAADLAQALDRQSPLLGRTLVVLGHPEADDLVRADRLPDPRDHRPAERQRVAPLVVPIVAPRAVRLVDEVTVRAVQLDPVETCFRGHAGGAPERIDHLLDLACGHPVGDLAARRLHAVERPQRPATEVVRRAHLSAEADELEHRSHPLGVHGLGQATDPVAHHHGPRGVGLDEDRLEDDHPEAACRAAPLVLDELLAGIGRIPRSERTVCGRDQAVAERERPDVDGREQQRKSIDPHDTDISEQRLV